MDFKGLLAGAQGGDCNCAKKQQCDQCAYGVFGYPCIADPCDQCLCGGGLATPPGSACLQCTDSSICSDGNTQGSNCLTGRNGTCEPDLEIRRKSLFLGNGPATAGTDFYVEVTFYIQGPLCNMFVSWGSSVPVQKVRVFALASQFGTIAGANDPNAQCFEGIRYTAINGTNVNYNIVSQSLVYDPRFTYSGVPGLAYGASAVGPLSGVSWGMSSGSNNFRDATYSCPPGVTGDNLPLSFKVVVDGGGIQASSLNNAFTAQNAPNADSVGTHWIMIPDRGLCVGSAGLATQNDGSYTQYSQSTGCVNGCFANTGAPVFADPASTFKKRDPAQAKVVNNLNLGAAFGGQ